MEHGIDSKAQGQERDDLSGAGVEGEHGESEGATAQATGHRHADQKYRAGSQGSLATTE